MASRQSETVSGGKAKLAGLVGKIKPHLDAIQAAQSKADETALMRGRDAGRLLAECKAIIDDDPLTKWEGWVEVKLRINRRTANNYMRIAARWPEIEAAQCKTVREALDTLRINDGKTTRTTRIKRPLTVGRVEEVIAEAKLKIKVPDAIALLSALGIRVTEGDADEVEAAPVAGKGVAA